MAGEGRARDERATSDPPRHRRGRRHRQGLRRHAVGGHGRASKPSPWPTSGSPPPRRWPSGSAARRSRRPTSSWPSTASTRSCSARPPVTHPELAAALLRPRRRRAVARSRSPSTGTRPPPWRRGRRAAGRRCSRWPPSSASATTSIAARDLLADGLARRRPPGRERLHVAGRHGRALEHRPRHQRRRRPRRQRHPLRRPRPLRRSARSPRSWPWRPAGRQGFVVEDTVHAAPAHRGRRRRHGRPVVEHRQVASPTSSASTAPSGEVRVGWRESAWRRYGGDWEVIGTGYAKGPAMGGALDAFCRGRPGRGTRWRSRTDDGIAAAPVHRRRLRVARQRRLGEARRAAARRPRGQRR